MIMGALSAGLVVGFFNLLPRKVQDNLHHVSTGALILLLFSMGARLGSDRELMSDIGSLGMQSLGLALAAIIGSMLAVFLFEQARRKVVTDQSAVSGEVKQQ